MKIYLLLLSVILVAVIYFSGVRVGQLRCQANNAMDIQTENENFIKKLEVINAQVNNTGTDDIRRILRQKYTIAE